MQFTKRDLDWAVDEAIIDGGVRDNLVAAFTRRYEHRSSLTLPNVLYFFGGMVVIMAMTYYITDAWNALTPQTVLALALSYAAVFLGTGWWLWHKRHRIPGGVLITAAVCVVPLATYALQKILGWWGGGGCPGDYQLFYHWVKSGWLGMEAATIVAGVVAVRCFRFPFVTMPVAFALWFMSMDVTGLIYGQDFSWDERKIVSVWFGLGMIAAAYLVDRRTKEDFAFWGYLFGAIAFWGGLSLLDSDSEWAKFSYFLINVCMMVVSVLVDRRVFVILGGFGAMGYFGHLARSVFEDSLAFSLALCVIGLGIIGLGLLYHRHEKRLSAWVKRRLPEAVVRTLPENRQ